MSEWRSSQYFNLIDRNRPKELNLNRYLEMMYENVNMAMKYGSINKSKT